MPSPPAVLPPALSCSNALFMVSFSSPEVGGNTKPAAQRYIQLIEKEKLYPNPIVTQIEPEAPFYLAEEYHQNYYNQNKEQGYCQMVIAPKLAKLRTYYSSKLK
jgi:hypothetical protein